MLDCWIVQSSLDLGIITFRSDAVEAGARDKDSFTVGNSEEASVSERMKHKTLSISPKCFQLLVAQRSIFASHCLVFIIQIVAAMFSAVAQKSFFRRPLKEDIKGHKSHVSGMFIAIILVLAYTINAVIVWASAPIVETYSAGDVRNFGIIGLDFNISCPSCVPFQSLELTNSTTEQFRVWHGYNAVDYPHCAAAGAPEDMATVDEAFSSASICYSSDDISERSGIVVSLWNMSTGGQGNRANVIVSGPSLVVNTPLEFWHEKTLLLGMNVFRDKDNCVSASECNLHRELYLGSMQYDGRVAGYPGGKLNIRLLRSAHVYTRTPGQTLFDVFGAVGGAYGLIVGLVGTCVHKMTSFEISGDAVSTAAEPEDQEVPTPDPGALEESLPWGVGDSLINHKSHAQGMRKMAISAEVKHCTFYVLFTFLLFSRGRDAKLGFEIWNVFCLSFCLSRLWNLQFAYGFVKMHTRTTSACHAFAKCGEFACRYLALRKKRSLSFGLFVPSKALGNWNLWAAISLDFDQTICGRWRIISSRMSRQLWNWIFFAFSQVLNLEKVEKQIHTFSMTGAPRL